MIANIYLTAGGFLTSRVDEDTSHLLGDSVLYNGQRYVIVKIEEREHIDYQTIVRINSLVEKSEEAEIDEVTINAEIG